MTEIATVEAITDEFTEIAPTYAKIIKAGKGVFRVETKEADDLDIWPSLVAENLTEAAALELVANAGYTLVPSWQVAMKTEGWDAFSARTTLA